MKSSGKLRSRIAKESNVPRRRKEKKRHPYTGSKAIDKTCRCHGGCPACESNRFHSTNKRMQSMDDQIKEWMDDFPS